MSHSLYLGDCLDVMKDIPDNSVDSVVCDPPYGLSFMGKAWDYDVPTVDIWKECLRVLKPGGHLLAFAGTRTQHRMAVNIEDAGFEIRDMLAWVYGSGFPKSLDVSKQLDKMAGATREIVSEKKTNSGGMAHISKTNAEHGFRPAAYTGNGEDKSAANVIQVTVPATPEAQQWSGWGTALKPSLEPVTVARKPLVGTVAENVLQYGTGGINIDGCRVEYDKDDHVMKYDGYSNGTYKSEYEGGTSYKHGTQVQINPFGRWPANLIHDGSDQVMKLFPQTGPSKGGAAFVGARGGNVYQDKNDGTEKRDPGFGDTGSAARFFYCAKTSKKERGEGNDHPTVKPIALMAYLCRLVTPPNGTVLDPFMGSGSTGLAAEQENFNFIGIERDEHYFNIAKRRLETANPLSAFMVED